MSDPKTLLSSREFAKQAGISTSTVAKWLRSEKIKGNKQGGKWVIPADQLTIAATLGTEAKQTAAAIVKADKQRPHSTPGKPDATSYTIEEFSAMTYLTPFGVERYLKQGRLSGTKNASGQWLVHRTNLDKAEIQRLVRK